MKINIAIDGPGGAGKSSVAKIVATKLGYVHLDTGAMYRLTAYKALQNNIAIDDEVNIVNMLKNTVIDMKSDGSILLDGTKVNDEIRTPHMSTMASEVSKLKDVRAYLVAMQQDIAKNKGYILDGRDIGSVVLKDAELKIFLTASSKARAKRRHLQNIERNIPSNLEDIIIELDKRDYQDSNRENSPLVQAEDAVLVDTSDITLDETIDKIIELVNEVTND